MADKRVHIRLPSNAFGNYVWGVGYVQGAPIKSFCGKLLDAHYNDPKWVWPSERDPSIKQKEYCQSCLNRVAR